MLECIKYYLNFASPFFGLAGTILIFFFGVPRKINTEEKQSLLIEQEDEKEKIEIKKYQKLGNVGLLLLIFSFAMEFLLRVI